MKKTRSRLLSLTLLSLAGLVLAACSGAQAAGPEAEAPVATAEQVEAQAPQASQNDPNPIEIPQYWVEKAPRLDEQGAVVVEVIPLNLNNPAGSLDFEVIMNTHSVDLGMNLAELATLTTDSGKTVTPIGWDGAAGGHHVSGTLSFPDNLDGAALMEGVSKLTLTLVNVDAPERIFVWEK